jgi:type I restriction enzyme S subunit
MYYYLQSSLFRSKIFEYETGTVNQGNISGKDIMNMLIPIPSKEKQIYLSKKIESIKEKSNNLLTQQSEKLKQLQSLKSSLLDRAFKGELV